MANLYFVGEVERPSLHIELERPLSFFFSECVHMMCLASTKTRSFCILKDKVCSFDKDAKLVYKKIS